MKYKLSAIFSEILSLKLLVKTLIVVDSVVFRENLDMNLLKDERKWIIILCGVDLHLGAASGESRPGGVPPND